jgi:hypothetical protein
VAVSVAVLASVAAASPTVMSTGAAVDAVRRSPARTFALPISPTPLLASAVTGASSSGTSTGVSRASASSVVIVTSST